MDGSDRKTRLDAMQCFFLFLVLSAAVLIDIW